MITPERFLELLEESKNGEVKLRNILNEEDYIFYGIMKQNSGNYSLLSTNGAVYPIGEVEEPKSCWEELIELDDWNQYSSAWFIKKWESTLKKLTKPIEEE